MEPAATTAPSTPAESMWCKSVPNLPRVYDNTMLKILKECGYKHLLRTITGLREKKVHPRLRFGIEYHKTLEHYEYLKAGGMSVLEANDAACLAAMKRMVGFTSDDNSRTTLTLVRAVTWYVTKFASDPMKTYIRPNGKPAVELSFRVELPLLNPDGNPYLYCGHMDRVVEFDNGLYVDEYKTTGSALNERYFNQFSPDGQVSGYKYGGEIILSEPIKGVVIDACQLGVNFNRFQRRQIMRTKGQIDEWLQNTCSLIKEAERFTQENDYTMRETSCHNYGGCEFRPSCSKDPGVRRMYLKEDFEVNYWNPLENRSL